MKTRHRIPSIFNLSMVDVLCCALGCVILLWLLFYREAKERAEAQGKTGEQLLAKEKALSASDLDRDSLRASLTVAELELIKIRKERDSLEQMVASVKDSLAAARKRELLTDDQLKKAMLELALLHEELSTTDKRQRLTAEELKKALLERDKLQDVVLVSRKEQDLAKLALGQLQKILDKNKLELRDLTDKKLALEGNLDQKAKEAADLATRMATALNTIGLMEKQIADKQGIAAMSAKQAEKLAGKLQITEELVKKLEKEAAALVLMQRNQGAKIDDATARALALEVELERGKLALRTADKKNEDLLKNVNRLEALLAVTDADLIKAAQQVKTLEGKAQILAGQIRAAEGRFAGIELKGERVIFLVDWSGSMRKKDYETNDPTKWPMVCESVGKLLASLPDLKQYQVILFSDEWHYPLGGDRKWIDYKGATSVKATVEALKRKEPTGGTNMADAMREAFNGFKKEGLDTIYVFSDGLPNTGPGLPEKYESLKESERTGLCCTWLREALKQWNTPAPGKQRVRINTIGFYFDSPEVGAFLWVLSREHEGSFVGMSRP